MCHSILEESGMGRRGYSPEFRRKVVDLVEAGRTVADVARDLGNERTVDLHLASARPHRPRVNAVLKAASASFAAELDRPSR